MTVVFATVRYFANILQTFSHSEPGGGGGQGLGGQQHPDWAKTIALNMPMINTAKIAMNFISIYDSKWTDQNCWND